MAKKAKSTKENAKKPTPNVLSINVCDTIIRDEKTKKVSLIGLFSTIQAHSFPASHELMHVYISMTNGHGKYETDVRFVNLEDNHPIVGMRGEVNFNSPLDVVEINIEWRDIPFKKPGNYAIEVLCDKNLVSSRKFQVIGLGNITPPTKGTEGV